MNFEKKVGYVSKELQDLFNKTNLPIWYTVGDREPWRGSEVTGISLNNGIIRDAIALDGDKVRVGIEEYYKKKEKEAIEILKKEGYSVELDKNTFFDVLPLGMSREFYEEKRRGKAVIASGGLPNPIGMILQHNSDRFQAPYTLQMMLESRKDTPLKYIWDYPEAVKRSIEATGEDIFKKVHDFNLNNYLKIPHAKILEIGRTEESKKAGVKHPDWRLLEIGENNTSKEILEVTQVPFNVGVDGFILYVGPEEMLCVGGRGGSTLAGVALFEGKTEILEKIGNSEELLEEIIVKIDENECNGLEFAVETKLDRGKPVKFYDVLGIAEIKK